MIPIADILFGLLPIRVFARGTVVQIRTGRLGFSRNSESLIFLAYIYIMWIPTSRDRTQVGLYEIPSVVGVEFSAARLC